MDDPDLAAGPQQQSGHESVAQAGWDDPEAGP